MKRRYVSIPEVKDLMEKLEKEREFSSFQKNVLKFAEEFSKVPAKKIKKLKDELLEIDLVNERLAIKIVDIMPSTPDELRAIFQKDKIILTLEDAQKILEILEKYR